MSKLFSPVSIILKSRFYLIKAHTKRCMCIIHHSAEGDYDFSELVADDSEFDEIKSNYIVDGRKAHSVFVCQPYIKFPGGFTETKSTPSLRLQESISLVHSIKGWKTIDGGLFAVSNFHQPLFFSEKIAKELEGRVKGPSITALFVAANRLFGRQQFALEKLLGVPVFDRFSIILSIFRHYASTAEARIQLGLAEVNYLKSRVNQYVPDSHGNRYSMGKTGKGAGMTSKQRYQKLLDDRAKLLRKGLEKLEKNRKSVRERRKELHIPTVSVIGYTNSGKTSLIKALSHDGNLSPEDRLFATLQVTAHHVKLPTIHKSLFLDSVGFISDIPKELIDSFNVTFKDVTCSDLLLHVYDASHPDLKNQKHTVFKTMEFLNFPNHLISSIINVANKVDLLDPSPENHPAIDQNDIPVSAVTEYNLKCLIDCIDSKLSQKTGQQTFKIRVPNGGQELTWLYRESSIQSVEPDDDANFLIVKTVMNDAQKKRFIAYFGKNRKSNNNC